MKLRKRHPRVPKPFIAVIACGIVAALLLAAYFFYHNSSQKDTRPPEKPSSSKNTKAAVDGTKKAPKEKKEYSVPAAHPRQLIIESLGISANVLPMGTTKDGALDAPKSAWDVGWYGESALPGKGLSALLIDGHVNDSLNSPGVFYKLSNLKTGSEIKIERGDKQIFTYRVAKVEQLPIEKVDMAKMLRSIAPGKEGLNLITCGGTYDYKRQTYNDRVLVYSVRTS